MKLLMLFLSCINQMLTFLPTTSLHPLESPTASNTLLISTIVLVLLMEHTLRCIFLLNYNLAIEIGKGRSHRISSLFVTSTCDLYIYWQGGKVQLMTLESYQTLKPLVAFQHRKESTG